MVNSIQMLPEKPKGGIKSKYPDEYRKLIAEDYFTTGLSYTQIQKRHDLPNRTLVVSFVGWYKRHYDMSKISLNFSKESEKIKVDSSQEKELQEMLQYAKLKIEALEKMIDIAEDYYKIEIRKKSGAKPFKK